MKRIFIVLLAFLPFIASADIWTGTGFALNSGYVVTNHHVVDGANTLLVSMVRNDVRKSYVAEVVATDAINDVAVIKITDKNFKGFGAIPYRVRTSLAEVGEDCFVLGYPMVQHMGTEVKLTNGIVSSRSGYQGDKSTYQITAPIQHGNSGGPLFDAQGNVIGITSSGITEAQNVGYAIKTSFLRNLIESELSVNPMPSNNTVANLNLAGKVKILKNFVFIILASDEYSYEYTEGTAISSPRPSATKGTHNGHEWVDLGLSVKWATCNVGATKPKEYGNYYAWGETSPKSSYTSSNYTYSSNPTTLPLNRDAVAVNWGGSWRMPTKAEQDELREKCKWTWTGRGYTVTGPNGNSIFLPAAGYRYDSDLYLAGSYGYYWSSSLDTGNSGYACSLDFGSDGVYWDFNTRYCGLSVRGVFSR